VLTEEAVINKLVFDEEDKDAVTLLGVMVLAIRGEVSIELERSEVEVPRIEEEIEVCIVEVGKTVNRIDSEITVEVGTTLDVSILPEVSVSIMLVLIGAVVLGWGLDIL